MHGSVWLRGGGDSGPASCYVSVFYLSSDVTQRRNLSGSPLVWIQLILAFSFPPPSSLLFLSSTFSVVDYLLVCVWLKLVFDGVFSLHEEHVILCTMTNSTFIFVPVWETTHLWISLRVSWLKPNREWPHGCIWSPILYLSSVSVLVISLGVIISFFLYSLFSSHCPVLGSPLVSLTVLHF